MYKNLVRNPTPVIETPKSIIDHNAIQNLIQYSLKLNELFASQTKIIDEIKQDHDKVSEKLAEIEKNIESLNNIEVPSNMKEYCCKGIYVSLEETSVEKKKLAELYDVEIAKLPKEEIQNVQDLIFTTIQDLKKATLALENVIIKPLI
jgi:hypothetical protein